MPYQKSKIIIGSKHVFNEEKIRRLNEEEFDTASNFQSRNNHGLIRGWGFVSVKN